MTTIIPVDHTRNLTVERFQLALEYLRTYGGEFGSQEHPYAQGGAIVYRIGPGEIRLSCSNTGTRLSLTLPTPLIAHVTVEGFLNRVASYADDAERRNAKLEQH